MELEDLAVGCVLVGLLAAIEPAKAEPPQFQVEVVAEQKCPCLCQCAAGKDCNCTACLCWECPGFDYNAAMNKALKEKRDLFVWVDAKPDISKNTNAVHVRAKSPWHGVTGPACIESYYRVEIDTAGFKLPWLEWKRTVDLRPKQQSMLTRPASRTVQSC